MNRVRTVLEMIKFEHSIFALPFALTGALLAARATHQPPHGLPTLKQILWIIVAMVSARSAAMTINRIADVRYDAKIRARNSAHSRPEPFRFPSPGSSRWLRSRIFVVSAWQLNLLALKLSPIALGSSFFLLLHEALHKLVASVSRLRARHFSRSRMDCHHWRTSIRAHVDSVRGSHAVGRRLRRVLRVPGHRLRPQRRSFLRSASDSASPTLCVIARIMHIGVVALLIWLAASFALPWPAWLGIAVVAALLGYEHSLVKADDLSKLDAAFFAMNGYISMSFLLFWGAAVALWRV